MTLRRYQRGAERALADALLADPEAVAVIRASIPGRRLAEIVDIRAPGRWDVPSDRISVLSRHLRGAVAVIARRTAAP
ncbi:MAG: hypothetical protein U1E53_24005 [Dongiaceae bacterium]